MKKIKLLALVFAVITAFAFTACGKSDNPDGSDDDPGAVKVTVSFNLNYIPAAGPAPAAPASKIVTVGKKYGALPAPERIGWEFRGWYDNAQGRGTQITAATDVEEDEDHALYANWKAETFKVTFDLNDGTYTGILPLGFSKDAGNNIVKTVTFGSGYGSMLNTEAFSKVNNLGDVYTFDYYYVIVGGAEVRIAHNTVGADTTYTTTSDTVVNIAEDHIVYVKWAQPKTVWSMSNLQDALIFHSKGWTDPFDTNESSSTIEPDTANGRVVVTNVQGGHSICVNHELTLKQGYKVTYVISGEHADPSFSSGSFAVRLGRLNAGDNFVLQPNQGVYFDTADIQNHTQKEITFNYNLGAYPSMYLRFDLGAMWNSADQGKPLAQRPLKDFKIYIHEIRITLPS